MRPRRLQSATILSMVTGPATGARRLQAVEHAALYAPSCERNVTICSILGYRGGDGRNGSAPAFPSDRVAHLARGARVASRRPRRAQAPARRLERPFLALL